MTEVLQMLLGVWVYLAIGWVWLGICAATGVMSLHPIPPRKEWQLVFMAGFIWPFIVYRLAISAFGAKS